VLRDEHHIQYSVCYPAPLLVMVALWVCADSWSRSRALAAVAVCMLVASTGGVYFAFFGCFLLLVAATYSALGGRRGATLVGLGLAAVTALTLVANLSPSILYRRAHGDVGVTRRLPEQAEIYGLKIAQMVLPITGHRLEGLAALKDRYNGNPLINENDSATLGAVGTVGFIGLLGVLVRRKSRRLPGDAVLDHLSVLNLGALVFGTMGGLGAVFAICVTPQIRHYNRISLFIAFIAFAAVAVWLERLVRRLDRSRGRRVLARLLIVAIVTLGLLDETSPSSVSDYEGERAQYENDRAFVRRIEAELPPDAMVFQVPFVPFPENGRQQRMFDYDQARGYLHSRRLRWSYAAMKGRETAAWQALVASMAPREMAETVALVGFRGIWVDRQGYPDDAAALAFEAELGRMLGVTPIVGGNGRLSFFSMVDYWRRLRQGLTQEEIARWRNVARHPVQVEWGRGFVLPHGLPEMASRWGKAVAQLSLRNDSRYPQRTTVHMVISGAGEGTLRVTSPLVSEVLPIDSTPLTVTWGVEVPPGTFTIRLDCSACARIYMPADRRILMLRVDGLRLERGGFPSGQG
jgi:phosphoglycerol transferase